MTKTLRERWQNLPPWAKGALGGLGAVFTAFVLTIDLKKSGKDNVKSRRPSGH